MTTTLIRTADINEFGTYTDEVVDSLKPGRPESLKVKPDGTVMNGNTRSEILRERRVNIKWIPREPYP